MQQGNTKHCMNMIKLLITHGAVVVCSLKTQCRCIFMFQFSKYIIMLTYISIQLHCIACVVITRAVVRLTKDVWEFPPLAKSWLFFPNCWTPSITHQALLMLLSSSDY